MTAPVVECLNMVKRFEDVLAVDGVSFVLKPGEILSILGPSASGKTTILRLLAGFDRVDEGEIRIQGHLASARGIHVPPERRNVGMVFQEHALFPHLNVAQNVLFGINKLPYQGRQRRLDEMLELVGLTGLEQRYPHELSGGQQQRVALARTLAPRPVTVLLDEPFSNVDATTRVDMRHEVESILRENQTTAIFVTHDREEAFVMADRVAVLREGRLDQIDEPDALYHAPTTRFVARMSGVANFLPGKVHDGQIVTELGRLAWAPSDQDCPNGTAVDVLVRLDDFQLAPDPGGNSVVVSREFRGDEVILAVKTQSGTTLRCRRHHYSTLAIRTRVRLFPIRGAPFVAFKREDPTS